MEATVANTSPTVHICHIPSSCPLNVLKNFDHDESSGPIDSTLQEEQRQICIFPLPDFVIQHPL
ncbi:MAG: hypothetical protein ABFR63_05310 [Thermodesulfobacteriota bacterium]